MDASLTDSAHSLRLVRVVCCVHSLSVATTGSVADSSARRLLPPSIGSPLPLQPAGTPRKTLAQLLPLVAAATSTAASTASSTGTSSSSTSTPTPAAASIAHMRAQPSEQAQFDSGQAAARQETEAAAGVGILHSLTDSALDDILSRIHPQR